MKFKVGDKVKVRGDRINSDYCMHTALELAPLIVNGTTITRATAFGYMIKGSKYWWTEGSLEAVPTEDKLIANTNVTPSVAEFKIGDRVRCFKSDDNPLVVGQTGSIIDFPGRGVLVEFDVNDVGRDGAYYGKPAHVGKGERCWCCSACELKLIANEPVAINFNQKIVITSDGTEATATLYDGDKEIKSAKSVMPKDVGFEFMSYAKSALKHLIKGCSRSNSAANARYPNGTVVCIENNLDKSAFTIGKAYNVADGEINDNTGFWRELNWLNNDPTSGFCVYNTEDGPLVKFVVFTGPAEIK